jgi:hypothetical protein
MNSPAAANYATFDTRNKHPILRFDGSTNESAVFSAIMPRHYAGGGVTVYVHWASTKTTGDCDWDVAWERIGDQEHDIDGDGFAAVNSVDGSGTPTTSGFVDIANVTFANGVDMDSVAVGEAFRLKLTRDAVSDQLGEDAQLIGIEVKET